MWQPQRWLSRVPTWVYVNLGSLLASFFNRRGLSIHKKPTIKVSVKSDGSKVTGVSVRTVDASVNVVVDQKLKN